MNTEMFWDGVAGVYSSSDMTHHKADFEMNTLFTFANTMTNIKGIASFGVADGNRDPIKIIKYLTDTPDILIVNDISSNMLDKTKSNLQQNGIHTNTIYVHNKIADIPDLGIDKNNVQPNFVFGVYNADYILESLELYKQNSEIIGTNFILTSLVMHDKTIKKADTIEFNICDFTNHTEKIKSMAQIENFYAYSIETDKNFVSHYFSHKMLTQFLFDIFGITVWSVVGDNDNKRYIVYNVCTNKNPNFLITMLNNVLGNIEYADHHKSLLNLKNLFM